MGKIERIQVPLEDRERLERLVKGRNTPQKIVWRSRIVLLAGEGNGAVAVARRVGKRGTVVADLCEELGISSQTLTGTSPLRAGYRSKERK